MKKKRKNKSMYLLLMLLLLASAGFATYAIYKTSARGSANVTAANWIVKVTANGSTVNVTGGANNINLGECAIHLAPGSSCTIPFTVDMTESEVNSILTVGIGSGIDASTLALMSEAGLSLKISDGTNEGYAYALNYGTTKVLNLVIDWEAGLEDDDNKASADVALSKTVGTLTIPVNMIIKQYNGEIYTKYNSSQEVYFDPTKSDQSECNDTVHTGATCMRWRVITINDEISDSTITLQLDHNLVNKVAWNTSGNNNDGPVTVLQSLANATSTWTNVDSLNYTYDTTTSAKNYGVLSCTNGVCDITKNNTTTTITGTTGANAIPPLKARLITGEEVAAITRTQTSGGNTIADNWSLATQDWFYFSNTGYKIGTQTSGEGNTNLSWLIENTTAYSSSGATSNGTNNSGYWTLSPCSSTGAFNVSSYDGNLSNNSVYIGSDYYYGARPVITIPKSKIQ